MQGKPAIRVPVPCGRDDWPASGREPAQLGWYAWAAQRHRDTSIIDVGSGLGAGIAYMQFLGAANVRGFDVDKRLSHIPQTTIGDSPLIAFGADSCDIVTCFDVIEHITEDATALDEMRAMAKIAVYVGTPNFSRSKAGNHCHAREYTIAEFANVFKPDEVWVASPDGWYNRSLLLKSDGASVHRLSLKTEILASWPCGEVPPNADFSSDSPDKLVWAHLCGVFFR